MGSRRAQRQELSERAGQLWAFSLGLATGAWVQQHHYNLIWLPLWVLVVGLWFHSRWRLRKLRKEADTESTPPPEYGQPSNLDARYIRSHHPYQFRPGEWAEILCTVEQDGRMCWLVEFTDGKRDLWVIEDSVADYEFSRNG